MVFQTETDILFGKCENFVYLQDLYLYDIDWAVKEVFYGNFCQSLSVRKAGIWDLRKVF